MSERVKKLLEGTVVSDKMDKVAVVKVETLVLHPLYKKQIVRSKKYFIRDNENECKKGNRVAFYLSQPHSKRTRYALEKVLDKLDNSNG